MENLSIFLRVDFRVFADWVLRSLIKISEISPSASFFQPSIVVAVVDSARVLLKNSVIEWLVLLAFSAADCRVDCKSVETHLNV